MAHMVYKRPAKENCPRCGAKEVRVAIYHFHSTYIAECAECGWGTVDGTDEEMAMARYYGRQLDAHRKSKP